MLASRGTAITQLKPAHQTFVRRYIGNGGNATQAYMKAYPNAKERSAWSSASRLVRQGKVRRAINEVMETYGVTTEKLSEKISELLSHEANDKLGLHAVDRGLVHARAILGLDAEKKSHLTVDKRSMNINVDVAKSVALLDELIRKARS